MIVNIVIFVYNVFILSLFIFGQVFIILKYEILRQFEQLKQLPATDDVVNYNKDSKACFLTI